MEDKEFINKINRQLLAMSEHEKTTWIYNNALAQTNSQQEKFLNSLKSQPSSKQKISESIFSISELKNWQVKIEKQENYFECFYYELYDEDYWDREEGYEYNDPFKVSPNILKALQTAEEWMLAGDYSRAADLYDWLCTIPFGAFDSEKKEWLADELDLEQLVEEQIIQVNLKNVGIQLLYAHYQATSMEKRPALLFRYLSWEMFEEIKLEDIFSLGAEEIKDKSLFMTAWITFLEKTIGDRAGELLTEACISFGGIEKLGKEAEKNALIHPILFENASKYFYVKEQFVECEAIGLRAIDMLAENLIVRSRIAELTIEVALQLDHKDLLGKLYEAAFRSRSTLPNYLRLFRLTDYEELRNRAANDAQSVPNLFAVKVSRTTSQLNENGLSAENKQLIRFFNKEFECVQNLCENKENYLDWENGIDNKIIALSLYMLDKNEEKSQAKEIVSRNIVRGLRTHDTKEAILASDLKRWKQTVKLTPEQIEDYLRWLEREIAKRAEVIVGGGHRKHYHKVAELIVWLGEVLLSNGKSREKFKLIEQYEKQYARKSAFIKELAQLN